MATIDRRIVVLQRGWVAVGNYSEVETNRIQLDNCNIIECWGTTEGLGQLALKGPTDKTKLRPCGTIKTHLGAVILTIPVLPKATTVTVSDGFVI